jgi:hypothetical protein
VWKESNHKSSIKTAYLDASSFSVRFYKIHPAFSCCLLHGDVSSSDYTALNDEISEEMERVCTEAMIFVLRERNPTKTLYQDSQCPS